MLAVVYHVLLSVNEFIRVLLWNGLCIFPQAQKCGIIESIMSWMKFKSQEKMNKIGGNKKHSKLKGIPKLDDANKAGTKDSAQCTLILTEGDSAKALAVAGVGAVTGRDYYGVFPLRGKLLNVRDAPQKQVMDNPEINNIIKIVGLRYKEKYDDPYEWAKTLRYGKIMIMTDQVTTLAQFHSSVNSHEV